MPKEIRAASFVVPDKIGRRMGKNLWTEEMLEGVAEKFQGDFSHVAQENGASFHGRIDDYRPQAVEKCLPLDIALYLVRDVRKQCGSLMPEISRVLYARELHKIVVVSLEPLPPNVEELVPPLRWTIERGGIALPFSLPEEDKTKQPLLFEQARSCTREWTKQLFEKVVSEKERCEEW